MTSISVIKKDITSLTVDAIVNAANSGLRGGGGVDGAIHAGAGPGLMNECATIIEKNGLCATGSAVTTSAGDLPAKWIIHTVGPIWGEEGEERSSLLLSSCYKSALDAASNLRADSVAFSAISTGAYGFPKRLAAPIAVSAVCSWLEAHQRAEAPSSIFLVCFDEENFRITKAVLDRLGPNNTPLVRTEGQ